MNVLCPNCQQKLSVTDENAGQLMKCPACSRYFSVPALPQTAAVAAGPAAAPASSFPAAPTSANAEASPHPGEEDTFALAPEPAEQTSPPRHEEPSSVRSAPLLHQQATSERPPPPPAGYEQTFIVWISPRVVCLIAPVTLILLLILMFFPWTGVYPGGYAIYTQNAFQMIWAGYSIDAVGEKVLGMSKAINGTIWANWLMIFYLVFILAALVLAAAPVVLAQMMYPIPRPLQPFWPWRSVFIVIALIAAFFILLSFLVNGSGFENAVAAAVEKKTEKKPATPASEEQLEQEQIKRALELSRLNLSRTFWLHSAVSLHILALAAASLELCLERRGARPLPRIEAYW